MQLVLIPLAHQAGRKQLCDWQWYRLDISSAHWNTMWYCSRPVVSPPRLAVDCNNLAILGKSWTASNFPWQEKLALMKWSVAVVWREPRSQPILITHDRHPTNLVNYDLSSLNGLDHGLIFRAIALPLLWWYCILSLHVIGTYHLTPADLGSDQKEDVYQVPIWYIPINSLAHSLFALQWTYV